MKERCRQGFEWLDEKNAADMLSQSELDNVTSEMGLALLDVADVIRPYLEIIDSLHNIIIVNFYDGLIQLKCEQETQDAIYAFLNKYGMRCAGEINEGY